MMMLLLFSTIIFDQQNGPENRAVFNDKKDRPEGRSFSMLENLTV